jgi:2-oxoglutarate ferredoxin oxidoreductase subunit alpha
MIPLTLPYTVKIIGSAGEGVISAGEMLLYAIAQSGFYGSMYREYPSTVQGGRSSAAVCFSKSYSFVPINKINCLFIRFLDSAENEVPFCDKNAVLIFDSSECIIAELVALLNKHRRQDINCLPIPLSVVENKRVADSFYSSIIVGCIGKVLSIPFEYIEQSVKYRFGKKDQSVVIKNGEMAKLGYQLQGQHFDLCSKRPLSGNIHGFQLLDGNELVVRGALTAGCTFFASYPITPSTGIGNLMSKALPEKGAVAIQSEDEIAAIGAAIGASFGGAKSMTATSGPGLSLMQEFISYASMVELPLVIIDVQRGGPSTGSPSQFGQEDLFAAAFGSHGESSHIVLAPDSIIDCYYTAIDAFNCAEQYQCPVIMLSDSFLGLTKITVSDTQLEECVVVNREVILTENAEYAEYDFKRFNLEKDTSPVPIPGISPVSYRVTGLEHDEYGNASDDLEMRLQQHRRRMNKTGSIEKQIPRLAQIDCITNEVDIGIIAWGGTAVITKGVVERLRTEGHRVAALYPRLLFPVCERAVQDLLALTSRVVVPESNDSGQFAKILRMYTDLRPHSILSVNGVPFSVELLHNEITAYLKRGPFGG